jgi:Zn-dependent M28 family amino/carboxypeptidase
VAWSAVLGAAVTVGLLARQTPASAGGAGSEAGLTGALAAVSAPAVKAHMAFLADDLLEGRQTGTRGYDLAARYVAAQLAALGLQPAGDDGTWFQKVPLLESTLAEGTMTIRVGNRAPRVLTVRDEFLMGASLLQPSARVEAPVVFAGFGVSAPELQHDDYAGRDVRGKVVAFLANAPSRFPSEQRAYHASHRRKAELAAAKGAIGTITVWTRQDEKVTPWASVITIVETPAVAWLNAAGVPSEVPKGVQAGVVITAAAAAALFDGAPVGFDTVLAEAEQGAPKGFDLPATVTLASRSTHRRLSSVNVVGKLPGADTALAATSVVYSAHLDHVGIGAAVDGDPIYNGAFDNALGSGALLETARVLAGLPERPARSIVFAFVTAEEKGLVGSDYLAAHPPAAIGRPIANVNMDMPVLLFPIATVVAFGAEHSTMGDVARRAATLAGLTLIPDPMPEQTLFVRSDQYSFVRKGVPAVFLVPGFTSSDPKIDGNARFGEFLGKHYHKPSDEIDLPLDAGAVDAFTRANVAIGYLIATSAEAPAWKADSFFGKTFGKPGR